MSSNGNRKTLVEMFSDKKMQMKMSCRESLKLVEKLWGEMFHVVVNHAIHCFFCIFSVPEFIFFSPSNFNGMPDGKQQFLEKRTKKLIEVE